MFLANAYVDLGTWNCFTPFVGAGIGAARNTLADFTDINPNGGYGFGRNPSEWHLAWALHAGVAYNVTKNFKVELAYRYLNYGSITDTVDCVGGCNPDSFKFSNLYSHDIMLGLRWTCCDVRRRRRVTSTRRRRRSTRRRCAAASRDGAHAQTSVNGRAGMVKIYG